VPTTASAFANAPDASFCALARLLTSIEYEPAAAVASALAVKRVSSAEAA
jgi:hypothetical protein